MPGFWTEHAKPQRLDRPLNEWKPLPWSEGCVVIVGLCALAWGILIGGVLALVAVV